MYPRAGWVVPPACLSATTRVVSAQTSSSCRSLRPVAVGFAQHHGISTLRGTHRTQPVVRASASSQASSEENLAPLRTPLLWRCIELATSLFPVWVALGSVIAFLYPPSFTWFQPKFIVIVLAAIMTGMGLTIEPKEFGLALSKPRVVLLGVLSQYCIMPMLGFCLGRGLGLSPDLAVGLILVSVCPGGAASNLVCLIGKADVALSVVLTLCSTMLSVVMIPSLMKLLAGSIVHITPLPLLVSTAQVVLAPLLVGSTLKRLAPNAVSRVARLVPLASVVGVTLICGSIVGRTSGSALSPLLLIAVALLHGFGGFFGFFVAKLFGLPTTSCRTVSIGKAMMLNFMQYMDALPIPFVSHSSITSPRLSPFISSFLLVSPSTEVMMQNSGLAVALAVAHFSSPLVAIPGALSSTMHSVMGSFLAGCWRIFDDRHKRDTEEL